MPPRAKTKANKKANKKANPLLSVVGDEDTDEHRAGNDGAYIPPSSQCLSGYSNQTFHMHGDRICFKEEHSSTDIEAGKDQSLEQTNSNLHAKVKKLEEILRALGSQATHHCGDSHSDDDNNDSDNRANEKTWQEFITKFMINWGNYIGETSAGLNGFFILSPIIDDFLSFDSKVASSSFFFDPAFTRLNISLLAISLSAPLVVWTIIGSTYCHKKQEIYNDLRERLLSSIRHAIHEAEHRNDKTDSEFKINSKTKLKLSEFDTITPKDLPPLDSKNRGRLLGDVAGHMLEFTGLNIYVLSLLTNDISIRLPLSIAILFCSYLACYSEQTTCENTLKRITALKEGKIVDDPQASGEANSWTTLSAVGKFPALLTASILDLNKAFYNYLPVAILIGAAIAIADTVCQYIINANNQSTGEISNQEEANENKTPTKWEQWNRLTNIGKGLVLSRAAGTAFERSAPILLLLCLELKLSKTNQSITAGLGFLLYLSTVYSLATYNDIPNLLRKDRPMLCGLIHTVKPSTSASPIEATSPMHGTTENTF